MEAIQRLGTYKKQRNKHLCRRSKPSKFRKLVYHIGAHTKRDEPSDLLKDAEDPGTEFCEFCHGG